MDDDLLVICSDKLFSFSLEAFVQFFSVKGGPVNACHDTGNREEIRERYGCVELDEQNRIVSFEEKPSQPRSTIKSIAFYIYPRAVLPLIQEYTRFAKNLDVPGHLSEWLSSRSPMYGWLIDGECEDVGDPDSLLRVNEKHAPGSFKEVRAVVELRTGLNLPMLEALNRILRDLSRWSWLTLVHLFAPKRFRKDLKKWFGKVPPPLPVNVLEGDAIDHKSLESSLNLVFHRGISDFYFDLQDIERRIVSDGSVTMKVGDFLE
jgi:hypothetical protein